MKYHSLPQGPEMNPFKRLAGESDSEVAFIRASGDCTCPYCGKLYYDHPMDRENLDFNGDAFLHILCNGERVKL